MTYMGSPVAVFVRRKSRSRRDVPTAPGCSSDVGGVYVGAPEAGGRARGRGNVEVAACRPCQMDPVHRPAHGRAPTATRASVRSCHALHRRGRPFVQPDLAALARKSRTADGVNRVIRTRVAAVASSRVSGASRRDCRRRPRSRAALWPDLPGPRRVTPRRRLPGGRLRFDALVRYLQDVSNDDTRDAGFDDVMGWVVRRTVIEVGSSPSTWSRRLSTWCCGDGGRWAERRVQSSARGAGTSRRRRCGCTSTPTRCGRRSCRRASTALFGPSARGRTVGPGCSHAERAGGRGVR